MKSPLALGHMPIQSDRTIRALITRAILVLVLLRGLFLWMIVWPAYTSGLASLAQRGVDTKGIEVVVAGYSAPGAVGTISILAGMLISGVVVKLAPIASLLLIGAMWFTRTQWSRASLIGWSSALMISWAPILITASAASAFIRWLWD